MKKGATIGANATIICGNVIGQYAFVGAGSVVTNESLTLHWSMATPLACWVCECGVKLDFGEGTQAQCPRRGKPYQRKDEEGVAVKSD